MKKKILLVVEADLYLAFREYCKLNDRSMNGILREYMAKVSK